MDLIAEVKQYKIPLLLGGVSVLSIVLSLILLVQSSQTTTPIQFSSDSVEATSAATVIVDVEGGVVHPGVYTLPVGSRVEDAIVAAGGLGRDIDEELLAKTVNRAATIQDGTKVYIPSIGISLTSHNISETQNSMVSVNFATAAELDVLPGVGPVTAQKIIDNRPYQTLGELVSKKAIGASLYEKLKTSLSL